MKKCEVTNHFSIRFYERVGEENINKVIKEVLTFGISNKDIPDDGCYKYLKKYMGGNKIYYQGYIYVFDNPNFNTLITVYKCENTLLNALVDNLGFRELILKIKQKYLNIVLLEEKVCSITLNYNKKYRYKKLNNPNLIAKISKTFINYFNSVIYPMDLNIYFEQYSDIEKMIYKIICKIPYGASVSYKELSHMLPNYVPPQMIGKIIKSCNIAILIPTHRVVYSNKYIKLSEMNQMLLNIEMKKEIYVKKCFTFTIESKEDVYGKRRNVMSK